MPPMTAARWTAGADGIAHYRANGGQTTACGLPAVRPRDSWPEVIRCEACELERDDGAAVLAHDGSPTYQPAEGLHSRRAARQFTPPIDESVTVRASEGRGTSRARLTADGDGPTQREGDRPVTIDVTAKPTTAPKWRAPFFDQPMPISRSSLLPMGEDARGRQWFFSRWGEVVETQVVDGERGLPNSLMIDLEDGRFQLLGLYGPGTYEALGTPKPPRPAKPARAHRPMDALGSLLLTRHGSTPGRASMGGDARQPVDGPAAILALLEAKGCSVKLSTDRAAIVATSPGGRPPVGAIEVVMMAQPLLLAHLRGEPATCTAGDHVGAAPPAVTVAIGGALVCAAHRDGTL